MSFGKARPCAVPFFIWKRRRRIDHRQTADQLLATERQRESGHDLNVFRFYVGVIVFAGKLINETVVEIGETEAITAFDKLSYFIAESFHHEINKRLLLFTRTDIGNSDIAFYPSNERAKAIWKFLCSSQRAFFQRVKSRGIKLAWNG